MPCPAFEALSADHSLVQAAAALEAGSDQKQVVGSVTRSYHFCSNCCRDS